MKDVSSTDAVVALHKVGNHTWALPMVDDRQSLVETVDALRGLGATKAADYLERRSKSLPRHGIESSSRG